VENFVLKRQSYGSVNYKLIWTKINFEHIFFLNVIGQKACFLVWENHQKDNLCQNSDKNSKKVEEFFLLEEGRAVKFHGHQIVCWIFLFEENDGVH
jgi:hypothetical protein